MSANETEGTGKFTVVLPLEQLAAVRELAAQTERTPSQIVRLAIRQLLERGESND